MRVWAWYVLPVAGFALMLGVQFSGILNPLLGVGLMVFSGSLIVCPPVCLGLRWLVRARQSLANDLECASSIASIAVGRAEQTAFRLADPNVAREASVKRINAYGEWNRHGKAMSLRLIRKAKLLGLPTGTLRDDVLSAREIDDLLAVAAALADLADAAHAKFNN